MQGVDYNTLNVTLGTRFFMAPELVTNEGPHDTAVDIWALGVTVFYLLTYGLYPFPGTTKVILDNKIMSYEPDLGRLDHLKAPAKEFVKKCLIKDKNARPSAAELLEDEFLNPNDGPLRVTRKSSLFRTVDELNEFSEMGEF